MGTVKTASETREGSAQSSRDGRSWTDRRGPVAYGIGIVLIGVAIAAASQLPIGSALQDLAARVWTTSDALIAVGVLLVLIALLAGTAFPTTYLPALWAIAPLIPGLAAITVVATYLVAPPGGPGAKFFIGVEIAAAIAVIGAIPLRILATVRVAQTRSYWELRRRSEQLRARLKVIDECGPPTRAHQPQAVWTTSQKMALAEATEQLDAVQEALLTPPSESKTNGLEWVSAMGYVSLWRRVDRAEEALIEVEPCELVLGDALHDQLRLAGADIKSDQLDRALAEAVKAMSPTAHERYFAPTTRPRSNGSDEGGLGGAAPAQPSAGGPLPAIRARLRGESTRQADERNDCNEDDSSARAILREVRHAMNSYLEDKMEGIVRARNRLWRAILVTATTTFLLVGLAVLYEVPTPQLIAASVFFLVAAIVGLFNRLRLQAKADSAVEDFNLFEARLIHTPLISGLAGVAGVFLVAVAPVAVAPAASSQPLDGVSLSGIFDLSHNLLGLIVAAGFGLAPDRIIGPLQDQTEKLKSQLKLGQAAVETDMSTQATATPNAPADGSP